MTGLNPPARPPLRSPYGVDLPDDGDDRAAMLAAATEAAAGHTHRAEELTGGPAGDATATLAKAAVYATLALAAETRALRLATTPPEAGPR